MDDVDDGAVEADPSNRYVRYNEELGRGSFKIVYKAFDRLNGIEVAWNQIGIHAVLEKCATLESLHSEISLLRSLKHDKIVKFYKSWIDEKHNRVNIITELFTSGSLRQYREKHKKVNIKALKGWARQILVGLDYLHSLNPPVIHRDLKCDNIFINGNLGEVKIGDLGLATVMKHSTSLGAYGTLEFMAPEMYKKEDYNVLVDVYSFGMCLLEMMTFDCPYSECKSRGQLYKTVCARIPPAALYKIEDKEMKAFIEKCIAPADRRLSAKELLKDPFLNVPERPNQAAIPKSDQPNNHSAPPKEPTAAVKRSISSNCIEASISNPPIIYVVKNSGDLGSYSILEVRKKVKDVEFRLQGKLVDENTMSLLFRIIDGHAVSGTLEFPFNLNSDTALSIASEMAEERVQIAANNVELMSVMIDSLLVNLVDGWEPCVPVNRLVILDKECISVGKVPTGSDHYMHSVKSYQNSTSSSGDCNPTTSTNGAKLDAAVINKSHSPPSSNASMDCNGCNANSTANSSGELHDNIHSGAPANINVNEDDDQLKMELETIELQYQQAIKDMFQMRQKAVSEARHRAARKLSAVH